MAVFSPRGGGFGSYPAWIIAGRFFAPKSARPLWCEYYRGRPKASLPRAPAVGDSGKFGEFGEFGELGEFGEFGEFGESGEFREFGGLTSLARSAGSASEANLSAS